VHCIDDIDNEKCDTALPITFPNGETAYAGINIRPYARKCLKYAS
jgi:hypothetical protein